MLRSICCDRKPIVNRSSVFESMIALAVRRLLATVLTFAVRPETPPRPCRALIGLRNSFSPNELILRLGSAREF